MILRCLAEWFIRSGAQTSFAFFKYFPCENCDEGGADGRDFLFFAGGCVLSSPKKTKLFVAVIACCVICDAQASESIFCGRSLEQKSIKNIHVPCPENAVCFGGWSRWKLRVDRAIEGEQVPKQFYVAVFHSAEYSPAAQASFRFFRVKPIDDAQKRKLFGADYVLVNWSKDGDNQTCGTHLEASDGGG